MDEQSGEVAQPALVTNVSLDAVRDEQKKEYYFPIRRGAQITSQLGGGMTRRQDGYMPLSRKITPSTVRHR